MFTTTLRIGLAIVVLGLLGTPVAQAQRIDQKTGLSVDEPIEIPGHVLAAGTYVFRIADIGNNKIVQVLTEDESRIIASILTIEDHRLDPTADTVITFAEVPRGAPEAVRAWFYPGKTIGNEFVYPRARAGELARAAGVPVPAILADVETVEELVEAPVVAVTPDQRELPVEAVIQVAPAPTQTPAPAAVQARTELPRTATTIPTIAILGFGAALAGAAWLTILRSRRSRAFTR
jgi:hypothetical protein